MPGLSLLTPKCIRIGPTQWNAEAQLADRTHMKGLALLFFAAGAAGQAAIGASDPIPFEATGMDAFQTMRQRCEGAGQASWIRCQRAASRQEIFLRARCDVTREQARDVCVLDAMEREARDDWKVAAPSVPVSDRPIGH